MRKMLLAGAALAALVLVAPGHAAVTVDQGVTAADAGTALGGLADTNSDSMYGQGTILAAGFTLASGNYTLGALSWWGNLASGTNPATSFTIGFYAPASGGEPANTPLATTTVTATGTPTAYDDSYGINILAYSLSPLPSFVIHSDGNLFVAINGNSAGDEAFFWTFHDDGGSFYQREAGGTNGWSAANPAGNLAFRAVFDEVVGQPSDVPEPASWALMTLGFGAAGAALRRRTVRVAAA